MQRPPHSLCVYVWRGGRGDAGIDNCGSLVLHPKVRKLVLPHGRRRIRSPPFSVVQKVISPAQSLPPPLPFSEPGTPPHFLRSVPVPDNSSRDRDVEPGPKRDCFTSDLSLPSSARTPAPPGAIRSDPPRSNRPAAPAPHLGRAAPGPTGHRLSDRFYSTHCPGAGIYIWLSPPPLACPKKLLESWKRFRRAPWLPEGEKMPKTSPKPPRLPPLCLRAALPAPGSYCPLDRLGWGPCFLEPGHSWTPAPKFCSQGLEAASHVVHTACSGHTSLLPHETSLICPSR